MLGRELVYTGITRARQAFTLVAAQPGLLAQAVQARTQRASGLRERLEPGRPLTADADRLRGRWRRADRGLLQWAHAIPAPLPLAGLSSAGMVCPVRRAATVSPFVATASLERICSGTGQAQFVLSGGPALPALDHALDCPCAALLSRPAASWRWRCRRWHPTHAAAPRVLASVAVRTAAPARPWPTRSRIGS